MRLLRIESNVRYGVVTDGLEEDQVAFGQVLGGAEAVDVLGEELLDAGPWDVDLIDFGKKAFQRKAEQSIPFLSVPPHL